MEKRFLLLEMAITALLVVLCGMGALVHLWQGNFATVLWFGFPLCFAVPALRDDWKHLTSDDE